METNDPNCIKCVTNYLIDSGEGNDASERPNRFNHAPANHDAVPMLNDELVVRLSEWGVSQTFSLSKNWNLLLCTAGNLVAIQNGS